VKNREEKEKKKGGGRKREKEAMKAAKRGKMPVNRKKESHLNVKREMGKEVAGRQRCNSVAIDKKKKEKKPVCERKGLKKHQIANKTVVKRGGKGDAP